MWLMLPMFFVWFLHFFYENNYCWIQIRLKKVPLNLAMLPLCPESFNFVQHWQKNDCWMNEFFIFIVLFVSSFKYIWCLKRTLHIIAYFRMCWYSLKHSPNICWHLLRAACYSLRLLELCHNTRPLSLSLSLLAQLYSFLRVLYF